MYYIYKPPSIKGCVQKSNFAIISYSHQKVSKRFWFMIFVFGFCFFHFDLHSKKGARNRAIGARCEWPSKVIWFFFIVCEKRYKIQVFSLQYTVPKRVTSAQKQFEIRKRKGEQLKRENMIQNLHICWHTVLILYSVYIVTFENFSPFTYVVVCSFKSSQLLIG